MFLTFYFDLKLLQEKLADPLYLHVYLKLLISVPEKEGNAHGGLLEHNFVQIDFIVARLHSISHVFHEIVGLTKLIMALDNLT